MSIVKPTKVTIAPGAAPAPLRSLLVAVDLTPGADRVLARVARLPLTADARVTLVHVVPGSLPPAAQRKATRDATRALADEARHLRTQLDRKVRVELRVMVGAAAKEIAAAAATAQADLIVVGRGGGRALRDAFLGSTAERVVRQAQRPVLVVRLPARGAYRRPALALDLDQAAPAAVRLLLRVVPPPRPRVDVIHAYDIPYHGWVYPSLSEAAQERADEYRTRATQAVMRLLASTLAATHVAPADGPRWKTHVRHASPRTLVEKVTTAAETDLLVLGTHGHAKAAFVFLGTVAGDVLRAAKCDVLVVPPAPATRGRG